MWSLMGGEEGGSERSVRSQTPALRHTLGTRAQVSISRQLGAQGQGPGGPLPQLCVGSWALQILL